MSIKKALVAFLMKIMPKSRRRFMVLSSLFPKLDPQIDEKTLQNLNEALGVATNIHAMSVPMSLSSDIWDEESTEIIKRLQKQKEAQIHQPGLVEALYSKIPQALRYDLGDFSKDFMISQSIVGQHQKEKA